MTSKGHDAKKIQSLLDLYKEEDLDERLKAYVIEAGPLGHVLKHPLVFMVPYHEMLNAQANQQLKYKLEAIDTAIKKKEYARYVFLHERPHRLEALDEIESELEHDMYWKLVHDVWVDTENAYQNYEIWQYLWDSDREGRFENVMEDEERDFLVSLPTEFEVHRGFTQDGAEIGLSWTLDFSKAKWFATRLWHESHEGHPRVATVKVRKSDVYAFLDSRNEKEIVIDPERFIYPITIKDL